MKPFFLIICSLFSLLSIAQGYTEQNTTWMQGWTNFNPKQTAYPETTELIEQDITEDTFLSNDHTYLISGEVYVTKGATLTIEEGTVIRCDYENKATLIVTKGAKLIAAGTKKSPIVFTSDKPIGSRTNGDWGGIIIAGSGTTNLISNSGTISQVSRPEHRMFGGNIPDEETTVLRYVRIEFSGAKKNTEENAGGLSLYGIGSASLLENIMISYAAQDSFHWEGGQHMARNLISLKAVENDFRVTDGFKGELSTIVAIRHPYITSPKGSYAIAIDGYDSEYGRSAIEEVSTLVVENASLINLADSKNYTHTKAAIATNTLGALYIHNSKISGFSDVVAFDTSYTTTAMIEDSFIMDTSFFNIHGRGVQLKGNPLTHNVLKYNRFTSEFMPVSDLFQDPMNPLLPKLTLKRTSNPYMVMQ